MTTANATAITANTSILSVPTYDHFVAVQDCEAWKLESGWEMREDADDRMAEMVVNEGFSADHVRVWNRVNALNNVEHEVKEDKKKKSNSGKKETKDEVEPLSKEEKAELKKLKTQVEKGLKSYINTGYALSIIRDERLYRETHTDFNVFCQENFDIDKTMASKLITASKVAGVFMSNSLPVPNNEGQARKLSIFMRDPKDTGLDIECMLAFWKELTGKNAKKTDRRVQTSAAKKLTAKYIEEKRKELYPTKEEIRQAEELKKIEENKGKIEENKGKIKTEPAIKKNEPEDEGEVSADFSKAQAKIEELQAELEQKQEQVNNLEMGNSIVTRELNNAKKAATLPDHDLMKAVLSAGFKAMAAKLQADAEKMKALAELRVDINKKVKFADFDISSLIG